ncbi:hypothetical protein QA601_08465 [Chitinispirillales bacterium ANBcel5]|uniref:hypothetical protein n=1 Tax=Cellulosispirillum alkaliphilum TaxID=3039283 RepID=UPI002A560B30|nr:hypothetical protein [Chitinispirillales bacterium ANBcel5]
MRLKKQNKGRKINRWFFLLPICIILSAMVVINNLDFATDFGAGSDKNGHNNSAITRQEQIFFDKPETLVKVADSLNHPGEVKSVSLSDIRCSVSGRDDLSNLLSLELFTDSDEVYRELLFKRAELRVIVKNAMRHQQYGAIRNSLLIKELMKALDSIIESGSLINLEINNFRIE